MEQEFIKPTEEGKNVLLLRYVIVFLFACLFKYLWWPIWTLYVSTLPVCQIEHWNRIYFETMIVILGIASIYLAIKARKIHSTLQYPLKKALVFKSKKIKRGSEAFKISILYYSLSILMLLSAIGTFINIHNDPKYNNVCEVTLFSSNNLEEPTS